MNHRSRNIFATSLMTTGVALAAIGCGEDVSASSPDTPIESTYSSSVTAAVQESSTSAAPESTVIVFEDPIHKPYNPARAKAEQCLFEAVQTAAGLISLSPHNERPTSTSIEYESLGGSTSSLENTGTSTEYPVRMRVDIVLDVASPHYVLDGTVDVNAVNPKSEGPITRPDNALLHANSSFGRGYWMSDATTLTHVETGKFVRLGDVDSDVEAADACGMTVGLQGRAGFETAAKQTYAK